MKNNNSWHKNGQFQNFDFWAFYDSSCRDFSLSLKCETEKVNINKLVNSAQCFATEPRWQSHKKNKKSILVVLQLCCAEIVDQYPRNKIMRMWLDIFECRIGIHFQFGRFFQTNDQRKPFSHVHQLAYSTAVKFVQSTFNGTMLTLYSPYIVKLGSPSVAVRDQIEVDRILPIFPNISLQRDQNTLWSTWKK
ncbi:PM-11, protein [Trichinella spiralis]|uniref:PM-11, protein n=1 Tax=Trichinella spiralis TaxID=6334 RepID=UPI0001EFE577|nr:PM-11, protein [Trichinella spiralis]